MLAELAVVGDSDKKGYRYTDFHHPNFDNCVTYEFSHKLSFKFNTAHE